MKRLKVHYRVTLSSGRVIQNSVSAGSWHKDFAAFDELRRAGSVKHIERKFQEETAWFPV